MISSILGGAMDGKVVFRRFAFSILTSADVYYINDINWTNKLYVIQLIGDNFGSGSLSCCGTFINGDSCLVWTANGLRNHDALGSGVDRYYYFYPEISNGRIKIEKNRLYYEEQNPLITIIEYDPV